jgi:hypothetical protein
MSSHFDLSRLNIPCCRCSAKVSSGKCSVCLSCLRLSRNIGSLSPYQTLGSFEPCRSPQHLPVLILTSVHWEFCSCFPMALVLLNTTFILADQFAARGWQVIISDYYEGEPFPLEISIVTLHSQLTNMVGQKRRKNVSKSLNLEEWADRHSHGRIDSLLSSFVTSARAGYPSRSVFAVGYCVDEKHALRLSS